MMIFLTTAINTDCPLLKPSHSRPTPHTQTASYTTHFRILPTYHPTPWLRTLKYIHFVTSPSRLISWLTTFYNLLPQTNNPKPYIVWEPSPASCTPENWSAFIEACGWADLVSPNHEEVAALCAGSGEVVEGEGVLERTKSVMKIVVKAYTNHHNTIPDPRPPQRPPPTLLTRCGPSGIVYTPSILSPSPPPLHLSLPLVPFTPQRDTAHTKQSVNTTTAQGAFSYCPVRKDDIVYDEGTDS